MSFNPQNNHGNSASIIVTIPPMRKRKLKWLVGPRSHGMWESRIWTWIHVAPWTWIHIALRSITTNKAAVGDGIPAELFQILKEEAVKMLHSICQQIWKTQQWPQDWKRSVFIAIPKKGNAKECSNYCKIALSLTH